jgi:hypothetical protein
MLHEIKVAMSGRDGRDLAENDERVARAGRAVLDLQKWFPQLQAAVEENDRTWSALGRNMRTVASTAQGIYGGDSPMQMALELLRDAGVRVGDPRANEDVADQQTAARSELSAFNDRVRQLRLHHEDCVQTLRNKIYYEDKVGALRRKDRERALKKGASDKDVERRMRNEQKLSEVTGELLFKADKLARELEAAVARKEQVAGVVLESYVHTQSEHFARSPMPAVLAAMPSSSWTRSASPKSVFWPAPGVAPSPYAPSSPATDLRTDTADQPPRAPSPVLGQAPACGLSRLHSAPTPAPSRRHRPPLSPRAGDSHYPAGVARHASLPPDAPPSPASGVYPAGGGPSNRPGAPLGRSSPPEIFSAARPPRPGVSPQGGRQCAPT